MAEDRPAEAKKAVSGDEAGRAPAAGKQRSFAGLFSLSKGALQFLGVSLAIMLLLGVLGMAVLGTLQSRLSYAEARNLRELDRIANSVAATTEMLKVMPDLHLVPKQLTFSLAPRSGCLVGKAAIPSTDGSTIDLTYHFVDPAKALAEAAPAAGAEESDLSALLATERCSFARTALLPKDDVRIELSESQVKASRHLPLADLLRAMARGGEPGAGSAAVDCGGLAGAQASPAPALASGDPVASCFTGKAVADLKKAGVRAPEELVRRSIAAAFAASTITAEARSDMAALGLEPSLKWFDAITVQVPGRPGSGGEAFVKLQAGEIPPFIGEGVDTLSQDQLVQMLTGTGGSRAASPAGKAAKPGEHESTLAQSSIRKIGNLLVFEKSYPFLGTLGCSQASPCRIMGIVSEARLNKPVRTLRGTEATIFLIGLLAFVGSLPLIHLALRKRLDPIGRPVQHAIWFSLTLLAASAMVASLTIWTQQVSWLAGQGDAASETRRIRTGFAEELDRSLEAIWQGLPSLGMGRAAFPLPEHRQSQNARSAEPEFPDTLELFNRDGSQARDRLRIADQLYPAYALDIGDRPYLRRAVAGRVSEWNLGKACEKDARIRFVVDRVFARPDGAVKTVFLLPTQQACGLARRLPVQAGADAADLPAFLVAAGYLKTFMRGPETPGLQFAVIDPDRPRRAANVLFHSQHELELVERFQEELSSPAAFDAAVKALHGSDDAPRRVSVDYRGQPVVLNLSKLHPSLPWILAVVESRDDASFAAWRAALFAFVTWLTAALLLMVVMLVARLRNIDSLDRRPALWAWPREVLENFTPPQFAQECRAEELFARAAAARDRHLLHVSIAGLTAVGSAEGMSRTFFAFGLVLAAFSARAYFCGSTARDSIGSRRLDRYFISLAWIFLTFSLATFVWVMATGQGGLGNAFIRIGRISLFGLALLWIGFELVRAGRCAFLGKLPPPAPSVRAPAFSWMLLSFLLGAVPAAAGYLNSRDQDYFLVGQRSQQVTADMRRQCEEMMRAALSSRDGQAPARINSYDSCTRPLSQDRNVDAPERVDQTTVAGTAMRLVGQHERALNYSDQPQFDVSEGLGRENLVRPGAALAACLFLIPLLLLMLAFVFFRRRFFSAPPPPFAGEDLRLLPPLTFSRQAFIHDILARAANRGAPPLPFEPVPGMRHLILGVDLDIRKEGDLQLLGDRILWVDLLDAAESGACECEIPDGANAIVIGNLDIALQLPGADRIDHTYQALAAIVEKAGKCDIPPHIFILADIEPLDRIALLRSRTGQEADARLIGDWRWASLLQDFALCVISSRTGCAANAVSRFPLLQQQDARPHALSPFAWRKELDRVAKRELRVINLRFAQELLLGLQINLRKAEMSVSPAAAEARRLAEEVSAALAAPAPPGRLMAFVRRLRLRLKAEAAAEMSARELAADAERLTVYIATQLADYYHKLWASSGDEERVILYHLAWGRHLKVGDCRAVRSLLTRGLLVRAPEYRLMNNSFARYIRRVERVELIETRAKRAEGIDLVWPLLRYPLAALVAGLAILLKMAAPEGNTGAIALVPALGAIIPALFGNLLRAKSQG